MTVSYTHLDVYKRQIIASSDRLIRRHLTVRLDAVFQTVQLPARIADLYSGLTDVD